MRNYTTQMDAARPPAENKALNGEYIDIL